MCCCALHSCTASVQFFINLTMKHSKERSQLKSVISGCRYNSSFESSDSKMRHSDNTACQLMHLMASCHRSHTPFSQSCTLENANTAAESSLGWLDFFLGHSLLLCKLLVPVIYPRLVQPLLLHITGPHCSLELSLADCNLFFCFCNLPPGPLYCSVGHR